MPDAGRDLSGHARPGWYGKSAGAALARYWVKMAVDADSLLGIRTSIGESGRFQVELSALIAGSFHLVILPVKILASVGASNSSPMSPGTL